VVVAAPCSEGRQTPLGRKFDSVLAENERFSPAELADALQQASAQLALVINLTKTKRYYQPNEISDACSTRNISAYFLQAPQLPL